MNSKHQSDLELLSTALKEAGEIALKYFHGSNRSWKKAGSSPVSEADHAVNDFLEYTLKSARPDYGWFSEESEQTSFDNRIERTFVIDPIDGTRGFLEGSHEWCVSAAIVENGRPIVGVLDAPKLKLHFKAAEESGSTCNQEPLLLPDSSRVLSATGSKRLNAMMADQFSSDITITDYVPSLAMRVAMVASGKLDVAYARSGAHDWDLAAADLILSQAGGCLVDDGGKPILYNLNGKRAPALIASSLGRKNEAVNLAKSTGILH